MMKKVYIVTAYKWGDINNNCYNIGVFDNLLTAILAAEKHFSYRGFKYECQFKECKLKVYEDEESNHMKIIYTTSIF